MQRRTTRDACLLVSAVSLLACATPPPEGAPAVSAREADEANPLKRAEALFASRDYAGARVALEQFLDDEPDHPQARYLLARTLASLGELRAARVHLLAVIDEQPKNPLAWDLLAGIRERLGEHRAAVEAYTRVADLSKSRDPLRGLARCYLYLGEPANALAAVEQARSRSADEDPWTELLGFRALKRLDRPRAAEVAARTFLDLVARDQNAGGFTSYLREVRGWLADHRTALDLSLRKTLIDYVRAACRLRMPSSDPPEKKILAQAPKRLFSADDRPVFVGLYAPGLRFVGKGRGRSLAGALKGAVTALQERPGFTPLKVRKAAVVIAVGRDLVGATPQDNDGQLTLKEGFQRGFHGLAFRADGREAFCLPFEPVLLDLTSLRACLEHAAVDAGLGPSAWETATGSLFRFEVEAFVSLAPGASPRDLIGADPAPRPKPTPRVLLDATERGARRLTRTLRPDGSVPQGYSPWTDRFDRKGADATAPVTLDPVRSAAVALAFSRTHTTIGKQRKVFLAAARHVAERLLKEVARDPAAVLPRAALLRALAGLGPSYAEARERLATELELNRATAPGTRRAIALALLSHHTTTQDPRWLTAARERIDDLKRLPNEARETGPLLVALSRVKDKTLARAAGARLVGWAKARAKLPPGNAMHEVPALAHAAAHASRSLHPDAAILRTAVLARAEQALALQLDARHRFACREPLRALGGFRQSLGRNHLPSAWSADCLLALVATLDLLRR